MVKEYHTRLTDIVRNYLEETYGIQSTEMTSDQTLEAFQGTAVCTEQTSSMLSQMLQTADMVKFAKSQPLPYQHDLSMKQAVEFVKLTAPQHEEPATSAKEDFSNSKTEHPDTTASSSKPMKEDPDSDKRNPDTGLSGTDNI